MEEQVCRTGVRGRREREKLIRKQQKENRSYNSRPGRPGAELR